ncbi:MAG: hypothetical protein NT166_16085 [Candidatus Aminicenantes bacterium]|nr:hypothetical protein [Candidatus Aminicenantes bacterium]
MILPINARISDFEFFFHHSSFIIHHSSFIIHHSSFYSNFAPYCRISSLLSSDKSLPG